LPRDLLPNLALDHPDVSHDNSRIVACSGIVQFGEPLMDDHLRRRMHVGHRGLQGLDVIAHLDTDRAYASIRLWRAPFET
jgi:hypothetical protein